MSWPTNYSLTSFQPMENCWKSRDYYKSRNSVAAFENTSGDLFFSFSDILLMTSGEKIGVFFLFWGWGGKPNKFLGCRALSFGDMEKWVNYACG